MKLAVFIGLGAVLSSLWASGPQAQQPYADLVVLNAAVTTLSEDRPTARAFSVKDGKFAKVGDPADLQSVIGPETQIIDAAGRRVIPGLIDSHSHFLRSGLTYTVEMRWDGVPTLSEGLEMIRQQAERTPEGEWVRVIGGWTPWQFEEGRMPTPEELTAAAPDTPVYVQYFYSVAVVNEKGLEALGINAETPDPAGGRFERDVQGRPSGLMLAEPHPGIFYGKIAALPEVAPEVQANSTLHLFHDLAAYGLTGVIDAGGGGFNYPKAYNTAEQLAADGQLPIRSSFYLFAQRPQKELQDFDNWSAANSAGTNSDPMKEHGFELDGGGEYILWEAADFENFRWARPELPDTMEANLKPVLALLVERRWPFKIHATYEESIVRILNVIEEIDRETSLAGLRWSVEHGETIRPETAARIQVLGGGLAIQNRMVFLGDDFVERYGAEAAKSTPPLRALVDMGIPLGMGTDATRGSTFNPWISLHYMITGETASGRRLYDAENLLTREEALRVHTIGSAWFSGEETVKGRIAPGQFADFAILSDDYFAVPDDGIKSIQSVLTVVDGAIVCGAEEFSRIAPEMPEVQPSWSPMRHFPPYWAPAQNGGE